MDESSNNCFRLRLYRPKTVDICQTRLKRFNEEDILRGRVPQFPLPLCAPLIMSNVLYGALRGKRSVFVKCLQIPLKNTTNMQHFLTVGA